MAKKISTRGVGRPSKVGDQAFIEVCRKVAASGGMVYDVVDTFKVLRDMPRDKAELYVSMRATNLRKKGIALPLFRRGRRPSKPSTPEVQAETQSVTETLETSVQVAETLANRAETMDALIAETPMTQVTDETRAQADAVIDALLASEA